MKKIPLFILSIILFSTVAFSVEQNSTQWELSDLKSFRFNGCSGVPDGNWGHCCYEHDFNYWVGGSFHERKNSDILLKECMDDVGGPGQLYYDFVRVGGPSHFGRAWPDQNIKSPLTEEELEIIEAERELWELIGRPPSFDFIRTESILFKQVSHEQNQMLKKKFAPYFETQGYKDFYKDYVEKMGRKPTSHLFHPEN